MTEVEMLAAEIRRAASGDPWYGPSAKAVLADVDDRAWSQAVDGLIAAHERLAQVLTSVSTEVLDETAATPTDAAGEPVTLRRVASGVAQHTAYLVGQLACLKHLLVSGSPGA